MPDRKVIIVGEDELLKVKIMGTIGVSNGRPYQYKVIAWTDVNDKHETNAVPTEGDPEFNEELQIFLNKDFPTNVLFVNVMKTNVTGTYLAGTGKTLLPLVKNIDTYREVELFGFEETGILQLSLNLMELEILGYASS